MKPIFLICCVIALALPGLTCAPEGAPSISVTEDSLLLSVTEVDDGIMIENLSTVACTGFVRSSEGEQQFELDVGERVTVSDVTKPIEVSSVSVGNS